MRSIKKIIAEEGPVRRAVPIFASTSKAGGLLEMVYGSHCGREQAVRKSGCNPPARRLLTPVPPALRSAQIRLTALAQGPLGGQVSGETRNRNVTDKSERLLCAGIQTHRDYRTGVSRTGVCADSLPAEPRPNLPAGEHPHRCLFPPRRLAAREAGISRIPAEPPPETEE